jgi:two-component system alkaline phosphatase synthesis response regulator PhoP
MNRTILVIDDEPDILTVVSLRLKKLGYQVLTAADGKQGLDTIRREKPDLVLLDLVMPFMNGTEVCRHVRNDPALKHIPIILFTASRCAAMTDERLKPLGADDCIIKPFEPEEFVAKVERILAQGAKV